MNLNGYRSVVFPPHGDNYLVNRNGSVYSVRAGKFLKAREVGSGYPGVALCLDGRRDDVPVHWLVAYTFMGPRPLGLVINHKDGVKKNSALDNLEYVTKSYDVKHAYANNLTPMGNRLGSKNNMSKINEEIARKIKRLWLAGFNKNYISRTLNVGSQITRRVVEGKFWRHVP